MMNRAAPLINVDEVTLTPLKHDPGFEALIGVIAAPPGATKLGCRLTVVPPGKKAYPHHVHHANDEMFVIVSGEGTLRFGEARYPVCQGDVIVCPAGGPENAHQLINSSAGELRYLAISTMLEPEVAEYPDSGKFGVLSGAAAGGDKSKWRPAFIGRASSSIDYYDGES
jgi:uncharacterized cupin superfamily protein